MDLNRVPGDGRPVIRGYGDGGFRIAEERFEGTVLIHADGVSTPAVRNLGDIGPALAADIIALAPRPEILLIGTGASPVTHPLSDPVRVQLRAAGIAIEIMATGPACRTFNVLLGEGRRIAAVLLPVDEP